MNKNIAYKKYFKFAFIINIIGIILTFSFSGNIGILGTLLIITASILAIIGFFKKKQSEK